MDGVLGAQAYQYAQSANDVQATLAMQTLKNSHDIEQSVVEQLIIAAPDPQAPQGEAQEVSPKMPYSTMEYVV